MSYFVVSLSILCLLSAVGQILNIKKSNYTRTPESEAFNAAMNAAIGVLGLALWWFS